MFCVSDGMPTDRVLVTGAAGFVGTALLRRLTERNGAGAEFLVRGATRSATATLPGNIEHAVAGDLTKGIDAASLLDGVTHVVHLAARVHVIHEHAADTLAEYRRVNVNASVQLAQAAAVRGVRRFVFLSSVKANGECTQPGEPFTEHIARRTSDPYGLSKLEAEDALLDVGARTGMEVTIVRPPLVYGPGVRANFSALMRAVERGLPLPLGAAANRRSLVGIDNLVDFIDVCLRHPAAAGEAFLVSDGDDLSTPVLIRKLASALGVRPRLLAIPPWVLIGMAVLAGRGDTARRLFDSLQVDITKARGRLGWSPPFTVDEQLHRIVRASRASRAIEASTPEPE